MLAVLCVFCCCRKLSGMEVITLELKRVGAFVARQLSMKNVDCELVTAVLSPDNKALYNKCVEIVRLFESVRLFGFRKKEIFLFGFSGNSCMKFLTRKSSELKNIGMNCSVF